MNNPVEVVERQAQIIAMQSETINELFQLLSQYMALDDLDRLPAVKRLNEAATLRSEIVPGWR